MENGKTIVSSEKLELMILRLSHQILERHHNPTDLCIIGIQDRGVLIAERIYRHVHYLCPPHTKIHFGKLDITFYRDDFRRRDKPLKAHHTDISFSVENKEIILIDDVVYTGRTVHAAISAIQDFGRPQKIEMLAIVDRRFNRQFPIKVDYIGTSVDALQAAYVRVKLKETDTQDEIVLFKS